MPRKRHKPEEIVAKLHSVNPLERLNGEIKRRTDVVGIFPDEAAITRLVGALLLEQSDEWAVQRGRVSEAAPAPSHRLIGVNQYRRGPHRLSITHMPRRDSRAQRDVGQA